MTMFTTAIFGLYGFFSWTLTSVVGAADFIAKIEYSTLMLQSQSIPLIT